MPLDGMRLDARYRDKLVLAVGAHPEDLDLGVGGTLARLSKTATVVMAVVCVPSQLELRLAETRKAAAILGCELTVLMPGACCRVEDIKTYRLVEMLDELARRRAPALVLSHAPSDVHKDHALVLNACVEAQALAGA